MCRYRYLVLAAAPLMLLLPACPAHADEFYYVAMFASQATPNDPNYAHTFAAFVRATGEGPCPAKFFVEDSFCISWLPRNLKIRTTSLLPESGANFSLHDTIKYALDNDERVSMWGPYQINQELYNNAVYQYRLLDSCQVKYKAVDSGYPTDRVSNCIHAVAACAAGYRARIISPGFGETASWFVLQRFRPFILDADQTHEWVYSYLDLACYPIIRRDFDRNPKSGVVWSVLKKAVGVEP